MTEAAVLLFREMADRIERNDPAVFGGALLMVSPDGGSVSVLLLDPDKPVEDFLSVCEAKVQFAKTAYLHAVQGNVPMVGARRFG